MGKLHAKRVRKLRKVEEDTSTEPTVVFVIPSPPAFNDTTTLKVRWEELPTRRIRLKPPKTYYFNDT